MGIGVKLNNIKIVVEDDYSELSFENDKTGDALVELFNENINEMEDVGIGTLNDDDNDEIIWEN